jgi:phosphoenolpyruvate-protein kinase (PTS system EI component)
MADQLAAEVDFFSIGTNDLSQYTMAADRTNGSVAALADAFQPAVLRLVRDVVQAAHSKGKWVGICGELAGEPLAIPLLLGLGLDELSMNPPAIPLAKQILRELTLEEASQIAQAALKMENPDQIRHWLESKNPL